MKLLKSLSQLLPPSLYELALTLCPDQERSPQIAIQHPDQPWNFPPFEPKDDQVLVNQRGEFFLPSQAPWKLPEIVALFEGQELYHHLCNQLPLLGKNILITRPQHQLQSLSQPLRQKGAFVVEAPTIEIQPISPNPPLQSALQDLKRYDWLLFTSTNGVHNFFNELHQARRDTRALAHLKIGCIGQKTAQELEQYGLFADLVPKQYVAESLLEEIRAQIPFLKGVRFLLPRAQKAREILPQTLRSWGAQIEVVPVYQTILCQESLSQIKPYQGPDFTLHRAVFTSSSTVHSFVKLWGEHPLPTATTIGPITSKSAQELGFSVAETAQEFTVEGIVQALL